MTMGGQRVVGDARRIAVMGSWLVCVLSVAASGAGFALVPVRASGGYATVGDCIILEGGGQRVFLEVHIPDWDPDQNGMPLLQAWQAAINSSGYTSGLEGTLVPYEHSCNDHSDCPPVLGDGSRCTRGFCDNFIIDSSRTDYVFNHPDISELRAVDVSSLDYRAGSTILEGDPIRSPGRPSYAATLVLWIPGNARGMFTIHPKPPPDCKLLDGNIQLIIPLDLTPARIVVVCETHADCDDGNACTDDICGQTGICGFQPNFDDSLFCCYPVDGTLCDKPIGPPGDFDGDGRVDLADFARLQVCFGSAPLSTACQGIDMDCDCNCDDLDVPEFVSGITGP